MQAGRLNEIFHAYSDKVEFLCVYIQEAHPEDGWQTQSNREQGIVFEQPKTEDERAVIAESCVLGLNLEIPMAMDDIENRVDNAYIALPDRLYVIDREGNIFYRSDPGPMGFDVNAWEKAVHEVSNQE
jgi:hypothetical protein